MAGLDLGDSISKQACSLFETVQSRDLLVGRSIEAGAAAAVFIACRMNQSRRVEAIAFYSSCSTETVWRTYRVFELPVPIQTAVDFLPEILRELETGEQVEPRLQTQVLDLAWDAAGSSKANGERRRSH